MIKISHDLSQKQTKYFFIHLIRPNYCGTEGITRKLQNNIFHEHRHKHPNKLLANSNIQVWFNIQKIKIYHINSLQKSHVMILINRNQTFDRFQFSSMTKKKKKKSLSANQNKEYLQKLIANHILHSEKKNERYSPIIGNKVRMSSPTKPIRQWTRCPSQYNKTRKK